MEEYRGAQNGTEFKEIMNSFPEKIRIILRDPWKLRRVLLRKELDRGKYRSVNRYLARLYGMEGGLIAWFALNLPNVGDAWDTPSRPVDWPRTDVSVSEDSEEEWVDEQEGERGWNV
jgi:hypothetical protein